MLSYPATTADNWTDDKDSLISRFLIGQCILQCSVSNRRWNTCQKRYFNFYPLVLGDILSYSSLLTNNRCTLNCDSGKCSVFFLPQTNWKWDIAWPEESQIRPSQDIAFKKKSFWNQFTWHCRLGHIRRYFYLISRQTNGLSHPVGQREFRLCLALSNFNSPLTLTVTLHVTVRYSRVRLDYISLWPEFHGFRLSGTWFRNIYVYILFTFLYFWTVGGYFVTFTSLSFVTLSVVLKSSSCFWPRSNHFQSTCTSQSFGRTHCGTILCLFFINLFNPLRVCRACRRVIKDTWLVHPNN